MSCGARRAFSSAPGGGPGAPGGGPEGGPNKQDDGFISEDEDGEQFESNRRFSNFTFFAGSLTLVCLLMYSNVMQNQRSQKRDQLQKELANKGTTYSGKANIGGPWLLYDTKGEPVRHTDFAGKYYLIYFGFTYCPDVCPISLMKMAKTVTAVKESNEFNYFDLEAIFVSVDPDRDSNERIEEYVKIFHPDLTGLTHKSNDHPELKELLRKFKIHVSKIYLNDEEAKEDMDNLRENAPKVADMLEAEEKAKQEEEEKAKENYTLDHSIVVYLVGPDNQFLTYLGSNLDEKAMTDITLDEISADLKRRVMPAK